MPGFNPENINIHDLTIEEPEEQRDVHFDLEKDITPEDREKMHTRINQLKYTDAGRYDLSKNIYKVSRLAANMKVIGEDPDLDSRDLNRLDKELNHFRKANDWGAFTELAKNLLLIGHEPKISNDDFENIKQDAIKRRSNTEADWLFNFFADEVEGLKLLGEEMPLLKSDWDLIEQGIAEKRKNKQYDYTLAKLVSQSIVLGRRPILTEEELGGMKKELEYLRGGNALPAAETEELPALAVSLAIFFSEKVEIPSGGGLKLVQHEKSDLSSESPDMPEQRKF